MTFFKLNQTVLASAKTKNETKKEKKEIQCLNYQVKNRKKRELQLSERKIGRNVLLR